jgi:hypothetical protein
VRRCAWCRGPLRPGQRADAETCSQHCRQARHRVAAAGPPLLATRDGSPPMTFAYADPPYPGMARRCYGEHPDYAGEVDHRELVDRLVGEFPDGWALSTSAAALPAVLALCPPDVRVAAWVRGERPTRSYRPLNAWEPVLYCGGRPILLEPAERRVDALVHGVAARRTDVDRVVGAKPAAFAHWMFALLGATAGDQLLDLFPGSGGIARAWRYASRRADPRDGCDLGQNDIRANVTRPGLVTP